MGRLQPGELSLEGQREATLDGLADYRATWMTYKDRVERSAGLDSGLNLEYGGINDHMNYLLERYFTLTAGVELEGHE